MLNLSERDMKQIILLGTVVVYLMSSCTKKQTTCATYSKDTTVKETDVNM